MIRYTITPSVHSPQALTVCTSDTLEDLAGLLADSYSVDEDKTASDLLIPVAEWTICHRKASNIDKMSRLFCVDLDGKTDNELETVWAGLEGLSLVLYTTHSHRTPRKDGLACYRALVELDREYSPDLYPLVWDSINRRLGGHLDPATRGHPELAYYLPSAAPGSCHLSDMHYQEGSPLSIEVLVAEARRAGGAEIPPRPTASRTGAVPSITVIKHQVNSWARSASDQLSRDAALGAKAILEGKNTIPVGEGARNNTLIRIAGYLAGQWPEAPPEGLARHFEGIGWDLLNTDGKYPLEALSGMIERLQESTLADRAQKAAQAIAQATGGERTEAISIHEMIKIRAIYGDEWLKRTVAVFRKDCYLLQPDGSYDPRPVDKENLLLAARDRFAVFTPYIEFTFIDGKGTERKKNLAQFLDDYGTVIHKVTYDLALTKAAWDPKELGILLPAAPPKVEPVYYDEIQEWLATLDPILCDVLSQVPYHDRMVPALVLTGSASTGKTLIANGTGQIYAQGPCDDAAAFAEHNANALLQCPVVFMDEKASPQYIKEGTSFVRKFLTQRVRLLNEKFRSRVELAGFLRLIVAANSVDVLTTSEDMSAADRAAFSERLVHVNMDPGGEVLARFGREHIHKNWIEGRQLAQHILYLSKHWEVLNPGKRFAVEQAKNDFHAGLASHSGSTQNVLIWLLLYLNNPAPAETAHLPLERQGGELRVHANALVQGWDQYLDAKSAPPPSQIYRAIQSLSRGQLSRQKIVRGKNSANAYLIDIGVLRAANGRYGICADFDKAIKNS